MESRYSMPSALETRVTSSRNQNALSLLKIEGFCVKYVGPGEEDSQAATTRTNYPAPPDCPLYYFEVKVVSQGQKGYIGIGYQTEGVILARLPGWESHSYGYHGDDGHVFNCHGRGREYGPTYGTGDTVGALLNRVEQSISFFKNGRPLGVAFTSVQEDRLFPCVGLRSRGEQVVVNLGLSGDAPFAADIAGLHLEVKAQTLRAIASVPVPLTASSPSQPLLPLLLYTHLLHHRCWDTARLIARDLLQLNPDAAPAAGAAAGEGPGAGAGAAAGAIAGLAIASGTGPHPAAATDSVMASLGNGAGANSSAAAVQEAGRAGPLQERPAALAAPGRQAGSSRAAAVSRAGQADGPRVGGGGDKAGAGEGQSMSCAGPAPWAAYQLLSEPAEVAARQAAFQLVQSGEIQAARAAIEARYGPSVLEQRPALDFRLKIAQFCELLRPGGAAAVETALTYGRNVLTAHSPKSPEDDELLADALSLLAYEEPATSPYGHLLNQAERSNMAEEVNRAILMHLGLPPLSPLERLAAQALTAVETLRQLNHPQAMLVNARAMVLGPQ
ncbi:hypothetical protein V8C86DRAFT_1082453 [Haematococcus lacustris]